MTSWAPSKLNDFFKNYSENNSNHVAAVDALQKAAAGFMFDEAAWVRLFRAKSETQGAQGAQDIPQEAIDIIKKYEGFRSEPYICPAGVPTIGYGNTYYPSTGKAVSVGDASISEQTAKVLLQECLEKDFLPAMKKIPYWSEMSNGKRGALLSFAYNLGANFYGSDDFGTITRRLRDKEWDLVPAALLMYRNPGSAFEEGLRRRRDEEGKLWLA